MISTKTVLNETPFWFIVVLLWLFPPLAWILLYRQSRYHLFLAHLTWLSVLLPLIGFYLIGMVTLPQLGTLYQIISLPYSPPLFLTGYAVIATILAAELVYAVFITRHPKTLEKHKAYLWGCIFVLFLNWVFLSFILPPVAFNLASPIVKLLTLSH